MTSTGLYIGDTAWVKYVAAVTGNLITGMSDEKEEGSEHAYEVDSSF